MKKKQQKFNKEERIANFCGIVGYFFGTLTWLWSALFYLNLLLTLDIFKSESSAPVAPTPKPTTSLNPTFNIIFAGLMIILMLGLTVYALLKIPKMVSQSSQQALKQISRLTIPLISRLHKKKLNKKQHFKLTLSVIVMLKAFLLIAPLGLIFASQLLKVQPEISLEIRALVGFFLAFWGLLGFLIQYSLAYFFKIKPDHLN